MSYYSNCFVCYSFFFINFFIYYLYRSFIFTKLFSCYYAFNNYSYKVSIYNIFQYIPAELVNCSTPSPISYHAQAAYTFSNVHPFCITTMLIIYIVPVRIRNLWRYHRLRVDLCYFRIGPILFKCRARATFGRVRLLLEIRFFSRAALFSCFFSLSLFLKIWYMRKFSRTTLSDPASLFLFSSKAVTIFRKIRKYLKFD